MNNFFIKNYKTDKKENSNKKIIRKKFNYSIFSKHISEHKKNYNISYNTIYTKPDLNTEIKCNNEENNHKLVNLKSLKKYFPDLENIKNNNELYKLSNMKDYYNKYLKIFNEKEYLIQKLNFKILNFDIGSDFEVLLDTNEKVIINLNNKYSNGNVKIIFDVINCSIFEAYVTNNNEIPQVNNCKYILKNKSILNVKLKENCNIFILLHCWEIFNCTVKTKYFNKFIIKKKQNFSQNNFITKKTLKNKLLKHTSLFKKLKLKINITKLQGNIKNKIKEKKINYIDKLKLIKDKKQKIINKNLENKKFKNSKYDVKTYFKFILISLINNKKKKKYFIKNWIFIIKLTNFHKNLNLYLNNLNKNFNNYRKLINYTYSLIYYFKIENIKKGKRVEKRIILENYYTFKILKLKNYKNNAKKIWINFVKDIYYKNLLLKKFNFLIFSINKTILKLSSNAKKYIIFKKIVKKKFEIEFNNHASIKFDNKIALKFEFFDFIFNKYFISIKLRIDPNTLIFSKKTKRERYYAVNKKVLISSLKFNENEIELYIKKELIEYIKNNKLFFN